MEFFERIDAFLEIPIESKLSDENEQCAVCHIYKKKWEFLYGKNWKQTDSDIFHELTHISLCIEGWPIAKHIPYRADYTKYTIERMWNLAYHTKIWEREKRCGFSQKERVTDELKEYVIPEYQDHNTVQKSYYGLEDQDYGWKLRYRVIYLASVLLSPVQIDHKNHLRTLLINNLPQPVYQQVDSICEVFVEHSQSFPQSLEIALGEVLKIIKSPLERLEIVPDDELPEPDPDFFAVIQKAFVED